MGDADANAASFQLRRGFGDRFCVLALIILAKQNDVLDVIWQAGSLQARRSQRHPSRVPGGLHGGQDRLDAFANYERITISGLSEANHAAFDTAERHSLLVPGDRSLAESV